MEYICLFAPAFISLFLKYRAEENLKAKILNIICYYFIMVNIINLSVMIVAKLFFNNYSFEFTTSFSIKYLLLANILAILYPLIIDKLKLRNIAWKNIKSYLKSFKIKDILTKIKYYFKENKRNILKIMLFLLLNLLFFMIIDIYLRSVASNIADYYSILMVYPNLFSVLYSLLFGIVILCFPKIVSRIILILVYVFNILLFLIQYMLLEIKSQAFSVYDLSNISEGLQYLNFVVSEINFKLVIILLLLVLILIINFIILNKIKRFKVFKCVVVLLITILLFWGLKEVLINKLTDYEKDGLWSELYSPGYYYDNFINNNRSFLVLGLYEYTFRDIYLYFQNIDEAYGNIEEIEEIIANSELEFTENDYTGIFEGKNLIMIQLESIDNLVINEDVMPTLTYMRENGWNFIGRYTNNRSTLYTEFAVLTGLYYLESEYIINNNSYLTSLPSIFNNNEYSTQIIHENFGKYYNREELHKRIGFTNRYFVNDILEDAESQFDPQLIENEELYNLIIPQSFDSFFSYIITISAHGPYTNNKYCDMNSESECYAYLSSLTDKMLEELLNNLEEDGLLEDTVIVLFSDHYPYAYEFSEEELAEIEQIDEAYNMRNIPFIIYAEGIESQEIDTLFNDVDVLPTILNLFGIEYDPRIYVGVDIFSEDHQDLIFLADYTWYDGNIYSGNYIEATDEYIANNEYMMDRLNFNRMIISNNYYSNSDLNLVE